MLNKFYLYKTQNLAILGTIVLLVFAVYSCNNDNVVPRDVDHKIGLRLANEDLIDSAGIYHNLGVDSVYKYYETTSDTIHVDSVIQIVNDYLSNVYGFAVYSLTDLEKDDVEAWRAEDDFDQLRIDAENAYADILDSLTTLEKDMIDDLFVESVRKSDSEFETYCDSMITAYNGKAWSTTGMDGELIGGALYIAAASADYEWTIETTRIPPADLWAYIIKWTELYIDQCIQNPPPGPWYSVCPGGDERIRESLEFALTISILKGLK